MNGQQNMYQQQQMNAIQQQQYMQMQNMNAMNNMNPMNAMQQQQYLQMQQMHRQQNQQRQQYMNNNNNNYGQRNMNMNMNMNGHNNNHRKNNNHSNNNHNSNKPTKDTWISPMQSREKNIDFFMYAYKVQPCSLRRNCQNKVTCPKWHHEGEKRRNPGQEPNFLYSEEPCPKLNFCVFLYRIFAPTDNCVYCVHSVKPQGSSKWKEPSRCPDGDKCTFSHTLLEQMYHPNIYKTSMCINFTNPKGNQCQWGYYCTHAHGQDDIRNKESDENNNKQCPIAPSKKNKNNNKDKNISKDESSKKQQTTTSSNNKSQNSRPKSQSDAPTMYTNNHMRTQYTNPMLMQSNGASHRMSPSNMTSSYAQYGQPQQPQSNGHLNRSVSPNMPSHPPSIPSHRSADFSPLPYQATNTNKYAQNPPSMTLQDHHSANGGAYMNGGNNYHANASYAAYMQRTKRDRSSTAPQLEPYRGGQPSQPPNMPNMYVRSDYNNNAAMNGHATNPSKNVSNASTPPPMTAEQVTSYYQKSSYNDISLPPATRPLRSTSVGGLLLNNEHARPPPPLTGMHKATSLPADKYQSKVPDLPSNETNYFMLDAPNDLGMKKRPWSKSEPLEKPKFDMISDSIWRSNSPQDKDKNGNKEIQGSKSAFSSPQKKLKSIPDNQPSIAKSDLFSPATTKMIDDIITPEAMTIKELQTPTDMAKASSYADYFGFPQKKKNEITLPATPPFIPQRVPSNKEDEIEKLKKKIKSLTQELDEYKNKSLDVISPRPPPLGSGSKASINYLSQKMNDDEKDKEEEEEEEETVVDMSNILTPIHKQKLARYAHFLTCPCCKKFDARTPRNTVLIPCGHLVCGKCVKQMDKSKECTLCKKKIEGYQMLVIG